MKKTIFVLSLFLAGVAVTGVQAQVSVGLSVNIAPPAIPVYEQPACPVDGYIWIPGYWAYGDAGYYWVPGYWDAPPTVGYLWTPGYWGFASGAYGWHAGYWGPHVGFYGGINYGFGYGGVGYGGGEWYGGHFRYNTAVTRVNRTVIHNTYVNRTVIRNTTSSRTSFNGGSGIQARPNAQQEAAMQERHVGGTTAQVQHERAAAHDHNQLANVNHGRPANAAVARTTAYHPAGGATGVGHGTNNAGHAGTANAGHAGAVNSGHAGGANTGHTGTTGVGRAMTMSHNQGANHAQMNHTPLNRPQVSHQPQVTRQPQMSHQPQVHSMSHNASPAGHAAPAVAHGAPHGGGGGGHHH